MPKLYPLPGPVARSLEVVGDRWTLLVVRELLLDERWAELERALPGILNLLAERLRLLEEEGVVEQATEDRVYTSPTRAATWPRSWPAWPPGAPATAASRPRPWPPTPAAAGPDPLQLRPLQQARPPRPWTSAASTDRVPINPGATGWRRRPRRRRWWPHHGGPVGRPR